ncbi:MAG: class I SAM-dependent methyltransferase [Pseudomonadota bacterium]
MADWSDGYVTDSIYTNNFHHQQRPTDIHLSCLLAGVTPPPLENFTYCDLGFGRGRTVTALAACHGNSEFWGTDFIADHVLEARRHAEHVGLENVHLFDDSFEEFLNRDTPQFDYITLHGIYSWVSLQVRQQICALLHKKLKVGGVVMISYNTLPGWAPLMAMREIMIAAMGGRIDRRPEAVHAAMKFVGDLAKNGTPGLPMGPHQRRLAADFGGRNIAYLIHEYCNEHLTAFYAHEVAADMAEAKLSYVGDAEHAHAISMATLGDSLKKIGDILTTPERQHGLLDFVRPSTFRSDVFMRGKVALNSADRRAMLESVTLAALAPEGHVRHMLAVPENEKNQAANFPREGIALMARALGDGPKTVAELRQASGIQHEPTMILALSIMISQFFAFPTYGPTPGNKTMEWNKKSLETLVERGHQATILSSELRSAVKMSWIEQNFLAGDLAETDPVAFAIAQYKRHAGVSEGAPEASKETEDLEERVKQMFDAFQQSYRPQLDRLGLGLPTAAAATGDITHPA